MSCSDETRSAVTLLWQRKRVGETTEIETRALFTHYFRPLAQPVPLITNHHKLFVISNHSTTSNLHQIAINDSPHETEYSFSLKSITFRQNDVQDRRKETRNVWRRSWDWAGLMLEPQNQRPDSISLNLTGFTITGLKFISLILCFTCGEF